MDFIFCFLLFFHFLGAADNWIVSRKNLNTERFEWS